MATQTKFETKLMEDPSQFPDNNNHEDKEFNDYFNNDNLEDEIEREMDGTSQDDNSHDDDEHEEETELEEEESNDDSENDDEEQEDETELEEEESNDDSENDDEEQEEVKDNKEKSFEELRKEILKDFEKQQKEKERVETELKKAEQEELKRKSDAEKLKKEIEDENNFDPLSVLDEEDKKNLDIVSKEYPEVSIALEAQKKVFNAVLEKNEKRKQREYVELYNKVVSDFLPILQPMYQDYLETVNNKNIAKITSVHPDYKELGEGLTKWVGTLKKENKDIFTKVLDNGTVDQIIELYDIYKQMNGIKTRDVVKEKKEADLERQKLELAKKQAQEKREKQKRSLNATPSRNTHTDTKKQKDSDKSFEDLFNEV